MNKQEIEYQENYTAVVVSDNYYPNGDAGSVREQVFCKMLQEDNYSVIHIGKSKSIANTPSVHEGVQVYQCGCYAKSFFFRIVNYFLFDIKCLEILKQILLRNDVKVLLLTGLHSKLIQNICRLIDKQYKHIKIIYNAVEWYSSELFKFGKLNHSYRNNEKVITRTISAPIKVIAISHYLTSQFKTRGVEACCIPFVVNSDEYSPINTINEKITFSYVGRPGNNKDHLKEMLEGFSLLPKEKREMITIKLVGMSVLALKECFGVTEQVLGLLDNSIEIFGIVPREDAIEILRKSDFSILLRSESQRYAKAGFPTKVSESLILGVPVITNNTSDIGEYVIDGESGIIVHGDNSLKFCEAIQLVLSFESSKICYMKYRARAIAEQSLDYRKFNNSFLSLISG